LTEEAPTRSSAEEPDHHREKRRLKDGPSHTQNGLVVANFDITPDQGEEQFPESDQLCPIDRDPSRPRANHQFSGRDVNFPIKEIGRVSRELIGRYGSLMHRIHEIFI
jgi:hypothetical protein